MKIGPGTASGSHQVVSTRHELLVLFASLIEAEQAVGRANLFAQTGMTPEQATALIAEIKPALSMNAPRPDPQSDQLGSRDAPRSRASADRLVLTLSAHALASLGNMVHIMIRAIPDEHEFQARTGTRRQEAIAVLDSLSSVQLSE